MKKFFLIISIALLFVLASCSDEQVVQEPITDVIEEIQDLPVEQTPSEEQEAIVPEDDRTELSFTTGLPCTPDEKKMRPIAVMINNNEVSLPQASVSLADIIYECNTEGGTTRLMALFSDWKNLDIIGSVRSARDYFISLSQSHGAIFVHAGGSPSAYEKLLNNKVDYIDGVNMNFLKNIFYRDKDRIRKCGYEHSMMTDGKKLASASDLLKYEKEYSKDFVSPYSFAAKKYAIIGDKATELTLKHSAYITVRFEYDEVSDKYLKWSFGSPHIDSENQAQLTFENVIVLYVSEKAVDTEGRLDIDLTSGGEGLYFTGGRYIEITWSREADDKPFVLKGDSGELLLNPGKTHITLFNKNHLNNITIK